MGTSKSYADVNKKNMPNWPELSRTVTRTCDGSTPTPDRTAGILRMYVEAIGGAGAASRVSNRSRKAARKTAKNIASVLGIVQAGGGIRDVLSYTGLSNIDGKTVEEIINHLIEFCSGPGSTVDDQAAKEASRILLEELMDSATDLNEIDTKLSQVFQTSDSEDLIIKYFAYYIYEHISIWFYDHLIKEKNQQDCESLFSHLRNFIVQRLGQLNKRNPLASVDWSSVGADQIISNIQRDVLTVFE